tara:strand:- start:471 stop:806 length:336 start_codon:yes stop_codon:yes gene_type:complete
MNSKKQLGLVYSVKEPKKKSVIRWFVVFLMLIQLSLIWPIYPLVGSIEPIVFGIPFSIAWVLLCLLLSFSGLLAFFIWENQKSERTDYKILRKSLPNEHQNLRPTSRSQDS